jgi:hypothetical protein
MKTQFNRFATFLAVLTTVSLIASVWSASRTIKEVQIVTVKQAIVMTEPERIDLFINELLTPHSASCFKKILTAESHSNPKALNKSSGAYGVGQLLASTYENIGLKKSDNSLAQVVAALAYISRHYGSGGTCAAWHSEQTTHSY